MIDPSLTTRKLWNRRPTTASRLLFIVGLTGAALLGASAHEAAAQNRVSQIDTAHYAVSLTASSYNSRLGEYQVGKPGTATFTVLSKVPATIDMNHPWTLTLHNPPGYKVSFVKTSYTRADAMIADGSVTFSVPFLAKDAGQGIIEGVVDVRVCSAAGVCDAKSETVSLAINIAAAPASAAPPSSNK